MKRCKELCLWPKAHFDMFVWKPQTASFEVFRKQQRKHNLSIKVTFIQYLTCVKVIFIDDLFVYTTIGAFTKAILVTTCKTDCSRESFSDVIYVSVICSRPISGRELTWVVKIDGAWSKLQNFIEPCYKQLIACFVRDIWH